MTASNVPNTSNTAPPPRQRRFRRKTIALGCLAFLAVLATAVWVWQRPVALSVEEQKLVGKWTLPVGPQPPPNAIQQFFELRADRRLIFNSRLIATQAPTGSSSGAWRLEDGDLVFEVPPAQSQASLLERIVGTGPHLKGAVIRQRLLGSDDARFRVEAAQGAVATFERVVE